jgi:SAM-dependent methyltransferase
VKVLTGWEDFHARWRGLRPPLRPHADVVAAINGAIEGADDHVLLLGATPELSGLGARLTAIDWSEAACAVIWPGDDARRRILRADWREMPLGEATVSAVIGDGSPCALASVDDLPRLFARLAAVLRPGGRVAIRCYLSPNAREPLTTVGAEAMAGRIGGFHALKWRIAMALADPAVPVVAIRAAFNALFPDRDALAAATGWDRRLIDEIDAYAGSPARFLFPDAAGLRATIPDSFTDVRFTPAGSYPLAERCPILTMTRRG